MSRPTSILSLRPTVLLGGALALLFGLLLFPSPSEASCEEGGAVRLQGGRFDVSVTYHLDDGLARQGHGGLLSDDTASFWFFTPANLEVVVKVLDGRGVNGHFWVFFGALSDLRYTVDVTDTSTGTVQSYSSTPGAPTSLADTSAFPEAPPRPRSWSTSPMAGSPSGLQAIGQAHLEEIDPLAEAPSALGHAHCEGGRAAGFPCSNVDLQALLPLSEMGVAAGDSVSGSDIWGFTDPKTGAEIALVALSNATAFVDVSRPTQPVYLGSLPSRGRSSVWRDVKTYGTYALIVADSSPGHGLQVFDLRRLRGVTEPQTWNEDATYDGFGSAHNVVVNEVAGMAYAVGSDECNGGLHMISVRNPLAPTFAGCFADDGYTHDAQCVYYTGPDAEFSERHVCFASNEDSLTIVDVTDPSSPEQLSRTDYAGRSYAHQAWLTSNQRFLLLDDETDERNNGHDTRTYIWDVSSLRSPRVLGTHTANSSAIDHNQYVHRGHAFQANYRAGLRILDLARIREGRLREVASFDVEPEDDAPRFNGAWSNYPFFDSGNVIVSDTGRGLFVLQPLLPGFAIPEAPSDLSATIRDFQVTLTWTAACHHAEGFRVYRRVGDGPDMLVAELPKGTSQYVDPDLFGGQQVTYSVVSFLGSNESAGVEATVTAPEIPNSCTPGGSDLCLAGGRFLVRVAFTVAAAPEASGAALPLTNDTGAFWFFDSANVELLVKVLDGRPVNGAFWVFTAGLSDVAHRVTVIDTQSGSVKIYENPAGTLASRADTSAFPAPLGG